jgi:hypothetical protein
MYPIPGVKIPLPLLLGAVADHMEREACEDEDDEEVKDRIDEKSQNLKTPSVLKPESGPVVTNPRLSR